VVDQLIARYHDGHILSLSVTVTEYFRFVNRLYRQNCFIFWHRPAALTRCLGHATLRSDARSGNGRGARPERHGPAACAARNRPAPPRREAGQFAAGAAGWAAG